MATTYIQCLPHVQVSNKSTTSWKSVFEAFPGILGSAWEKRLYCI